MKGRCTDVATNADLSGTWTAWLSSTTTDARDRIVDGQYQLVDGTVIANDKADLTDGTLAAPINLDENGDELGAGNVIAWTGTASDGTNSGLATCQDWTTADNGEVGRVGDTRETGDDWSDLEDQTCDLFNPLICFSDEAS